MNYLFDDYELDMRFFELRLRGEVIPLQPKPLDLLLYLLENRSRVVLKSELLARIWPGVSVTENALAQAVCAVRVALSEGGPDAIQCVRSRGYRFTRSVVEGEVMMPARAS
jgi:DNA-binding winged helix-turn-helix (wHTH) protein